MNRVISSKRLFGRCPLAASIPKASGTGWRSFARGESTPAVLYDNHHPKGHHRHYRQRTEPYEFLDIDRLLQDFRNDVQRVKEGKL